jgi:D-glycero-D-manno-heptose 1,7-bisphosphate phosphatase
MSALNKAVFLDRDGVLCEDTDYITSFEKLHIYPFAKKAVEQIHKKGYLAIVVTNQSGVARGYLAEEMLQKLNAYLQKETGVDAIYYCPHLPPEQEEIPPYRIHCTCRKPNAGMLQQAAAGTRTVFVKGRECSEQPDFVVSNVWEFAKSIKG